jgi:hypothetical protein
MSLHIARGFYKKEDLQDEQVINYILTRLPISLYFRAPKIYKYVCT